jgi:hypothetical protein
VSRAEEAVPANPNASATGGATENLRHIVPTLRTNYFKEVCVTNACLSSLIADSHIRNDHTWIWISSLGCLRVVRRLPHRNSLRQSKN